METDGAIHLPFLEWGVAGRPMPGETESGDHYFVHALPGGALLTVLDALGHGPDAAFAARAAVATLRDHAHEPLDTLVKRCHDRLRATNGVVVSIASFQSADRTLAWLGVGNVECLVMRGDSAACPPRVFLVARGGVVGYQLPNLRVTSLTVAEGDTLVFATDGIRHGFHEALNLGDPPQQIADRVLSRHARETDDALVLVARFIGLPPATEAHHDEQ
jgi:serine phosphatase RsbU (regulator of sigma subunit)